MMRCVVVKETSSGMARPRGGVPRRCNSKIIIDIVQLLASTSRLMPPNSYEADYYE